MGQRGIQDGLDYRGVPVIAAMTDVPGSPWYLVTKMDAAEVYAPIRKRLWLTLLLVGLLIGSMGTVIFLLWRQQRLVFQRRQLESALKIKNDEEAHQLILNTIMDGFLRLDREARVLEVNPTYCRMSGYSEKELLTLSVHDLNAESPEDIAAHIENIMAKGEDRFETRHRRKDGSIYEVELSAQFQPSENGQFVVFLHDITERKRTEKRCVRANLNSKRWLTPRRLPSTCRQALSKKPNISTRRLPSCSAIRWMRFRLRNIGGREPILTNPTAAR